MFYAIITQSPGTNYLAGRTWPQDIQLNSRVLHHKDSDMLKVCRGWKPLWEGQPWSSRRPHFQQRFPSSPLLHFLPLVEPTTFALWRPLTIMTSLLKDCQNASEDPTYYWTRAQTNIFPLVLLTTEITFCCSLMAPYSSCCYWQSWVSVERQGCSQGFHITFHADSWLSTGFTDLWWVSAASSITARMALKSGSVSGVSGVVSDGSLERSKSSGGWWKVT